MTSSKIRQAFIDFFVQRGHRHVPSAPVIPAEDPTLLFTNAGMNQFKDVFLGVRSRDYTRAVDTQKCIRVSGKHNDLEEVGRDTYHHTFFEMLGNWSFGDYFKREAIAWAWELLTGVYRIDPARLYATVFAGEEASGLEPDAEAQQLWTEVTPLPPERVLRFGRKDNFWEMGETGPCGPCSEIHIDLGPDRCDRQGVPGHVCKVNGGCARFVELWNLVFIQFDRRSETELVSLPARHVDTGAGLERICAVLQDKPSNYDTDLFAPIIQTVEQLSARTYRGKLGADAHADNAFRVIADHVRMLSFSIADGSAPGNEGRGYVQRRVLRRAVRFGRQYLGLREPFLFRLAPVVGRVMGGAFPEVLAQGERIASVIREEEVSFLRTLDRGISLFEDASRQAGPKGTIAGEDAFRLYETYGFPIDLTQLMAAERGQTVDMDAYDRRMKEHQAISAAGVKRKIEVLAGAPPTDDSPKYVGEHCAADILGFERGDRFVDEDTSVTAADGEVGLILNRTCFYAEQGGQVGDTGAIATKSGRFDVTDTIKVAATVVHIGKVIEGSIRFGQPAELAVKPVRADIRRHHTATHLLHWALRRVLGEHVQQAGSLVAADRLRFDFHHPKALTAEQIAQVERLVNERVLADEPLATQVLPLAEAKKLPGVRAFFGEKYEDTVRVVQIGDGFSREFCGGTHLDRTGRIGLFKITGEEAVAKGIRRVTAVAGLAALERVQQMDRCLGELAAVFKAPVEQLAERVEALQNELKQLKKAQAAGAADQVQEALRQIFSSADRLDGESLLCVGELPGASAEQMRGGIDWIRAKSKSSAVLLASRTADKVTLVAGVTDDLVARGGHAGNWVRQAAAAVGGSGGGRPQMAQAGGKEPAKLPDALADAKRAFRNMLAPS